MQASVWNPDRSNSNKGDDGPAPGAWKQTIDLPYDESSGQYTALINERYEWHDDFGQVAPDDPAKRAELFHRFMDEEIGEHIGKVLDARVEAKGPTQVKPFQQWDDAGIHPVVKENLAHMGYTTPMPIQQFVIPTMIKGSDVLAISQTGTGKTGAYLVPIVSRFMGKSRLIETGKPVSGERVQAQPLVLIVAPTRELAIQIFKDACRLCYRSKMRPCLLYGGAPRRAQVDDLMMGCDILIGTPGRLNDVIQNSPHAVSMARLKYTVLDEADEVMTAEWEDDLKILMSSSSANADHQLCLFSATFPGPLRRIARHWLADDYYRYKIGRIGSTHDHLNQSVIYVQPGAGDAALMDMFHDPNMRTRTVVFCNYNSAVDEVESLLHRNGFPVVGMHSQRTQMEREQAMRLFTTNQAQIIVCSGVAARGLDFQRVNHVINYQLPSVDHGGIVEYTHRIGRTARVGKGGQATSFFQPDKDAGLAPALVSMLIENSCEVPDFLEDYRAVDQQGAPVFDDDDSASEDDAATGGDTGWGGVEEGSGEAPVPAANIPNGVTDANAGGLAESFSAMAIGAKNEGGASYADSGW